MDDYILSEPIEWIGGTTNKTYRFKGAVKLVQEQPNAVIDNVDNFAMLALGMSLYYHFLISVLTISITFPPPFPLLDSKRHSTHQLSLSSLSSY